MEYEIKTLIPIIAVTVSIVSLSISYITWKATHRPIISVYVKSDGGGNRAIPYLIFVENSGNRPARDIRILVEDSALLRALNPSRRDGINEGITAVFSKHACIPVLPNNATRSAYFGFTSSNEAESSWIPNSEFEILVQYRDFNGRKYKGKMPLRIADTAGFTGYSWGEPSKS